ncbi:septum formation initiator family protein [bacterium]|nr:septum formation initiator family protein [candidate division CSSED10-310 bacterium]
MTRRDILHVCGLILVWIVISALIIFFLGNHRGYPANQRLRQAIAALEMENRRLEEENKRLAEEVRYRRSPQYTEELIRTELRQVGKDDILIIVPSPVPTDSDTRVPAGDFP